MKHLLIAVVALVCGMTTQVVPLPAPDPPTPQGWVPSWVNDTNESVIIFLGVKSTNYVRGWVIYDYQYAVHNK
jgi:hypothetical protein